jgi:hypothetical protein
MIRVANFRFSRIFYLFCLHVVPFGIAALLLIILSTPDEKLLLNIEKSLQKPNSVWLPAIILTLILTIVYFLTIYTQIYKAYLLSQGIYLKTMIVGVVYIAICWLMAYLVLISISPSKLFFAGITLGDIWCCYLLVVLSFIGIGWKMPDSLVKSVGITPPNYEDAHTAVRNIAELLRRVRLNKPLTNDIEDFVKSANDLRINIGKYIEIEPNRAKNALVLISEKLGILILQANQLFPQSEKNRLQEFVIACKYNKTVQYKDFIESLKTLGKFWNEWANKEA